MIKKKCDSNDVGVQMMASTIKKKYDKYWGNFGKLNVLLLWTPACGGPNPT